MSPQQHEAERLLEALRLCRELEPRLREVGAHVALTGSRLYGHPEPKPDAKYDIDLLIYPHNQSVFQHTPGFDREAVQDVLKAFGFYERSAGVYDYHDFVDHFRYIRDGQDGVNVDVFYASFVDVPSVAGVLQWIEKRAQEARSKLIAEKHALPVEAHDDSNESPSWSGEDDDSL